MLNQISLTEKLRPSRVDQLILPARIKDPLLKGAYNNLLLAGPQGTGKTSAAKALVNQFGYSFLYVNVSDESSVDVLRNKITTFCSEADLLNYSKPKVVILDEFDGASTQFYKAFRAISEKFHRVRFIATCNYLSSIPEPVQSRFEVISFILTKEEEKEVFPQYVKRIFGIMKKLNIDIDKDALYEFAKQNLPDFRTIIHKIQSFQIRGFTHVSLEDIRKNSAVFADIYKMIVEESNPQENYKYIVTNYSHKVDEVLHALGTDFIDWIFANEIEYAKIIKNVPAMVIAVSNHQTDRARALDPVVLLLSCIYTLQSLAIK